MVAHYGFMRKSDENGVENSGLNIFNLYLTTGETIIYYLITC